MGPRQTARYSSFRARSPTPSEEPLLSRKPWENGAACDSPPVQAPIKPGGEPEKVRLNPEAVEDVAQRALRRYLAKTLDRRPTSLAVVMGGRSVPAEDEAP